MLDQLLFFQMNHSNFRGESYSSPPLLFFLDPFECFREKPCPEPKPETSWEKFAKQKGIKKTKKERMVYDDIAKQFVPRYGYKGINQGIDDHVIVEVKKGEDPFADPWASAKVEKKERIAKNEQKRARNIERHEVGKGRGKKSAKSTTYSKFLFFFTCMSFCIRS